jgi:DinB family protein
MSSELEAQAMEKAREYFRTKATPLPVDVVRNRIADPFRAVEEFLAPLSAVQAASASIPGEWTIHEVVDHLVETYRPGLDELWCVLAGRRPPGDPIPANLQSKATLLRPWPWLLDELRRLHAEVLRTLAAVPDDFRTDAKAPLVMVVNVTDALGKTTPLAWVEDLDWKSYAIVSWRLHAIDHLNQARKVLAAAQA